MAGVGKTSLISKLAEELVPCYPDAQIYLDLMGNTKTPLYPFEILSRIMRSFDQEFTIPDSESELKNRYYSLLHGKRVLLLFDNVANSDQIVHITPPEGCALLFASRKRIILPGQFTVNLEVLSIDDACNLLLSIAPRIKISAYEISKLCGGVPLALRVAGRYIAEHVDTTPEEYISKLRSRKNLLKLIDASLSLSYDTISPQLQKYWRSLSVFSTSFDIKAVCDIWDIQPELAGSILSELVAYSLLEWDSSASRYKMHDLIQVFAYAKLTKVEIKDYKIKHAKYYLSVLQDANKLYNKGDSGILEAMKTINKELVNIQSGQAFVSKNAGNSKISAKLCNDYGKPSRILNLVLLPSIRIKWSKDAIVAARKLERFEDESEHLTNLGNSYIDSADLITAIDCYEKALSINRKRKNRESEGVILGNLGRAYLLLGEIQRSLDVLDQRLDIALELNDTLGEANCYSHLGNAHQRLGNYETALRYYNKALNIFRNKKDIFTEVLILQNIGTVKNQIGEARKALKYFQNAYSKIEKYEGHKGTVTASTLMNMGTAYTILGNNKRASEYYNKAMLEFQAVDSLEGEAKSLNNLGIVYLKRGNFRQASKYFIKSLDIKRKINDPLGIGFSLVNIANISMFSGNFSQAGLNIQEALTISRQIEHGNELYTKASIQSTLHQILAITFIPLTIYSAYGIPTNETIKVVAMIVGGISGYFVRYKVFAFRLCYAFIFARFIHSVFYSTTGVESIIIWVMGAITGILASIYINSYILKLISLLRIRYFFYIINRYLLK